MWEKLWFGEIPMLCEDRKNIYKKRDKKDMLETGPSGQLLHPFLLYIFPK